MKKMFLLIPLFFTLFSAFSQTIYSKAFGNKNNKPIIFVHGGPSGNAVQFEATTAQNLADKGFYVIVYDRRGEGRSADENAKLTYNEAFDDLNQLYKKYNLTDANLIGFSFGGLVATLFSEKYPQKVNSLILVSALFNQQESYNHILSSVRKIYTEKGETEKLKKVTWVENLDKNSAEYRGECFALASENGYFKVAKPDQEAEKIYRAYETGELYKSNIRNKKAPGIFYKNESRNNINVKPVLEDLKKKGIRIYALYGKQDGIFSPSQMTGMKRMTGTQNFKFLDNCSHYLYADQQKTFLNSIEGWLR
ncbi:alpha/beta hydrolase [Dyadobacter sp. LHD-138]|uniref:alpha/beta hydrolase n=1 Tax=Dyadobacter sp. LHD-138 TaxID=3071413 RepID=UPI0027E1646B|nr:alpha/beta hydrolase [Dyadobacter sp. LHD-138]MDQ6480851.1 alpha/beta hydrolase [Dyadobacter sp. LHD-138]